jgi:uncharacterized membrane protein
MTHRSRWPALVLTVAVLFATSAAWARSGGSMGGGFRSSGSRSSSSRSSGSSYRSSGSSYRSSGSSSGSWRPSGGTRYVPIVVGGSSYGYRSGSGSGSVLGAVIVLVIVGGVVVGVILLARRQRQKSETALALTIVHYDFGVQQVARDIQDKLEALAARVDVSTAEGLRDMLSTVARELRRRQEHIEFGSVEFTPALPPPEAEQQFHRWTDDARSKYGREVIRADRLGVQRQQKEIATDGLHDEDGQLAVAEYFVVTVVVAARNVAFPTELTSAQQLEEVLGLLGSIPAHQLEAAEIVWSPASQSDAMDREDMALRYPALAVL